MLSSHDCLFLGLKYLKNENVQEITPLKNFFWSLDINYRAFLVQYYLQNIVVYFLHKSGED